MKKLNIRNSGLKQFLAFAKKEFYHMMRDRKTIFMLFGVPVVQIVLFGFALTNEVKNAKIVIVDESKDIASAEIINKIAASPYFDVEKTSLRHDEIEAAFRQGKIRAAVIFPVNFYNDLMHLNKAQIQIISDASDPNTANTLKNYLSSIIMDYQSQLLRNSPASYRIIPEVRMLYNPELKGAPNFVPGVIAFVLLLICVTMTSISIVREKEMGTMEILLVSPFKPSMVIIAKAIPYLVLSLLNLTTILILSTYLLEMPIKGSVILLLAESTLFIISALSLGLLISTGAKTQVDAMMTGQMTMMLPAMLLTGFLFPVENMPIVLQVLSNLVPSRWYYIIVKDIMLKGLGFFAIWKETLVLAGITVVLIFINFKVFKIRLS